LRDTIKPVLRREEAFQVTLSYRLQDGTSRVEIGSDGCLVCKQRPSPAADQLRRFQENFQTCLHSWHIGIVPLPILKKGKG
jgi:hypothetical protein